MNSTPRRARLRALAKINLDLRVLGLRADGYHEIRTIFHTISLADRIEVEYTPARRTSIEVDCSPPIADNLVERAARMTLEAMGTDARVRFRLDKRIPMGAGLGGGSSDAAAVLLALPVLARRRLTMVTLHGLAARLGSDVPFFLLGGAAVGLGRGEELYPLPSLAPLPGVLVCPEIEVSTAEAYRWLNRTRLTKPVEFNMMDSFQALAWCLASSTPQPVGNRGWGAFCRNDFEEVVFRNYPRLKLLRGKLRKLGAEPVLMSGSGSSLFGIFTRTADVQRACLAMGRERVFPFRLVSRERYRSMWWRNLREHGNGKQWPPPDQRG